MKASPPNTSVPMAGNNAVGIPKTIALRSMSKRGLDDRRPFRYLNPSVTEESSSFLPPPSVATSGTRRISAAPIRNITTSIP